MNKNIISIIVAIIGFIATITAAIIGVMWGKENVSVTVNIDGKSVTLKNDDIQEIANNNEELKNNASDYEKQINNLKETNENLLGKLGIANGKLDDVPTIQYQDCGLSIDGEEKIINTDKSLVLINGRRYYSKDFVDNLLPDNKSAMEKDNMLYIGKIVKEKSNLFDRQMINKSKNVEVKKNARDTYGNFYNKAVIVGREINSITFNANREYSNLKFTLAVLEEEKGGSSIQIETEQGIIFTSEKITSTTEPTQIDIPINQALKITIKNLAKDWNYVIVADAILYNEE